MTTRVQPASATPSRVASAMGVAVLFAFVLAAPIRVAGAATVTDENVAELSATATSAADQEALATYYQEKAKEASAEAELHEKMARRGSGAASGKQTFNAMKRHCQRLVQAYHEAAESYESLAKLHSQLAREAQK